MLAKLRACRVWYFQLTFQFNPRPAHVVGALVGNHSLFA